MIITPDFVFIHHPKAGGTFVGRKLAEVYPPHRFVTKGVERAIFKTVRHSWPHERRLAARVYLRALGHIDVRKRIHGSCNSIPGPFKSLPIVASVRNPYEWYVSHFEFGWWKRSEPSPPRWLPEARERWPKFPDLSFEEHLEMAQLIGPYTAVSPPKAEGLGMQTREWIWRYCRHPRDVLARIAGLEAPQAAEIVRSDMHDVTFLRTEHLNADLVDLLRSYGHPEEVLEPILLSEKVLPVEGGRSKDQAWPRYYTPALKDRVRELEAVLFAVLPQFDV